MNSNKFDNVVDSLENLNEFEQTENVDVVKSLKDMIKDFESVLKD